MLLARNANSTLFADADPERCRQFYEVMQLVVEGNGVRDSYEKAPEQDIFEPKKHGLHKKFSRMQSHEIQQSPVHGVSQAIGINCGLGTPSYSLFGWQKPVIYWMIDMLKVSRNS